MEAGPFVVTAVSVSVVSVVVAAAVSEAGHAVVSMSAAVLVFGMMYNLAVVSWVPVGGQTVNCSWLSECVHKIWWVLCYC